MEKHNAVEELPSDISSRSVFSSLKVCIRDLFGVLVMFGFVENEIIEELRYVLHESSDNLRVLNYLVSQRAHLFRDDCWFRSITEFEKRRRYFKDLVTIVDFYEIDESFYKLRNLHIDQLEFCERIEKASINTWIRTSTGGDFIGPPDRISFSNSRKQCIIPFLIGGFRSFVTFR